VLWLTPLVRDRQEHNPEIQKSRMRNSLTGF